MLREMVRKNKQISHEECIAVLKNEPRGILSVLGDDDYPYGIPMNYWYCEEDGKIYFHSGKFGHKIEAMQKHDKVSFCVYDQGYRVEGDWALYIKSVVVFGRMQVVEDQDEAMEICRKLSYKYTSDTAFIEHEIARHGDRTLTLALVPEHMCGKLVHEQ